MELLSEIIKTNETELLDKIKLELNKITNDDETMSKWSQAETDLISDDDTTQIYLMLKKAFRNRQLESTTGGECEDETAYENAKKLLLQDLDEAENSKNKGELPIIVIPRGINFRTDHFSTAQKQTYLTNLNSIRTFYCASAYRFAGYDPGDINADEDELKNAANRIKQFITKLKETKPVTAWWSVSNKDYSEFSNLYYALQQRYTNSKDAFGKLWDEIPDDIRRIMEEIDTDAKALLSENIFVSGSSLIRHTIRYALGLSFSSSKLEYLANGRYRHDTGEAKYPTLGVIFFSFWKKKSYLKSGAVNVPKLHAQGEVHVVPDLLNETEVTFPGYMKNIKFSYPVLLPLFNKKYKIEDKKLFGFTKEQFDNFKQKIASTKRSAPERAEVENELVNHLLDHYEKMFMTIIRYKANELGYYLRFEYPNGKFKSKEPKPSDIKTQSKELHDSVMSIKAQSKLQTTHEQNIKHKKPAQKRKLSDTTILTSSSNSLDNSKQDFNPAKKQKTDINYLGKSLSKGLKTLSSAKNQKVVSNNTEHVHKNIQKLH